MSCFAWALSCRRGLFCTACISTTPTEPTSTRAQLARVTSCRSGRGVAGGDDADCYDPGLSRASDGFCHRHNRPDTRSLHRIRATGFGQALPDPLQAPREDGACDGLPEGAGREARRQRQFRHVGHPRRSMDSDAAVDAVGRTWRRGPRKCIRSAISIGARRSTSSKEGRKAQRRGKNFIRNGNGQITNPKRRVCAMPLPITPSIGVWSCVSSAGARVLGQPLRFSALPRFSADRDVAGQPSRRLHHREGSGPSAHLQ